jgi:Transposase DDE domain
LGSKHHVICAGNGIPLALTVTAANRNDITQLLELVDRIAPVGPRGKFRPPYCWPIVPTTAAAIAPSYETAASHRRSPSATPPTAPD